MATKNNTVEVTKFAPMVARTRDQLADLCTPESAHNWTLCYAEKQNGPPSKSQSFAKVVVGELEDPPLRDNVKHIIREVGQALEDIFAPVLRRPRALSITSPFGTSFTTPLYLQWVPLSPKDTNMKMRSRCATTCYHRFWRGQPR